MDLAGPVVGLIGLVAFVVAAALLCHWLLEPVNRAAGHLNAPTRFQLTDFIWLMMQLQIMLARGDANRCRGTPAAGSDRDSGSC